MNAGNASVWIVELAAGVAVCDSDILSCHKKVINTL